MEKKCPSCGSTQGQDEPGAYAMLKLSGRDTIQFNLDQSTTVVFTATLRTCGSCRYVSMFNAE